MLSCCLECRFRVAGNGLAAIAGADLKVQNSI